MWPKVVQAAQDLLESGQVAEARKLLSKIIESDESAPEELVGAHTLTGNILFGEGRKEEALTEYQLALKAMPDNRIAQMTLMKALIAVDRKLLDVHLSGIIRLYMEAEDLEGLSDFYREVSGIYANELGDYEKALEMLDEAMKVIELFGDERVGRAMDFLDRIDPELKAKFFASKLEKEEEDAGGE